MRQQERDNRRAAGGGGINNASAGGSRIPNARDRVAEQRILATAAKRNAAIEAGYKPADYGYDENFNKTGTKPAPAVAAAKPPAPPLAPGAGVTAPGTGSRIPSLLQPNAGQIRSKINGRDAGAELKRMRGEAVDRANKLTDPEAREAALPFGAGKSERDYDAGLARTKEAADREAAAAAAAKTPPTTEIAKTPAAVASPAVKTPATPETPKPGAPPAAPTAPSPGASSGAESAGNQPGGEGKLGLPWATPAHQGAAMFAGAGAVMKGLSKMQSVRALDLSGKATKSFVAMEMADSKLKPLLQQMRGIETARKLTDAEKATRLIGPQAKYASALDEVGAQGVRAAKLDRLAYKASDRAFKHAGAASRMVGKAAVPLQVAGMAIEGAQLLNAGHREARAKEFEQYADKGALRSGVESAMNPVAGLYSFGHQANEASKSNANAEAAGKSYDAAKSGFDRRQALLAESGISREQLRAMSQKERSALLKSIRARGAA